MYLWQVTRNIGAYQVVKQLRELEPGEPMHSGVRQTKGWYVTHTEAQQVADKLNELEKAVAALGYIDATVDYNDACFPRGSVFDGNSNREIIGYHRAIVSVNGEDIGIYDFDRHTFVD